MERMWFQIKKGLGYGYEMIVVMVKGGVDHIQELFMQLVTTVALLKDVLYFK